MPIGVTDESLKERIEGVFKSISALTKGDMVEPDELT